MNSKVKSCGWAKGILGGFLVLTVMLGSCSMASASEHFEISLAVYSDGGLYVAPVDGKITITKQPTPFYVKIKNVSLSTLKLWDKRVSAATDLIDLEITNDRGKKQVMRKKKKALSSDMAAFQYLSPGDSKVIHVMLNHDEWDALPVLGKTKSQTYQIRVIYLNGTKKIYSDTYSVTLKKSKN